MYTCAKYPPVMFRLYCLLRRPRLVSRMQSSMSLISAHKIFAKSLPVPPQWSKEVTLSSQQCRNSIAPSETPLVFPDSSICSAQWKECGEYDWSLKNTLGIFQSTIRSVHRRKICWPAQETFPSE